MLHHRSRHQSRDERHFRFLRSHRNVARHQRRATCLLGSSWSSNDTVSAGLLCGSALLGSVVRVLWPKLDLSDLIYSLQRFWLPVCFHAELRWVAHRPLSDWHSGECCSDECARSPCRHLGPGRAWKCYDSLCDHDVRGSCSRTCGQRVLQLDKTWRWSFYVLLWMAGATGVFLFTLPETLPSAVLHNKAQRIRKVQGNENLKAPNESSTHSLLGVYKVALMRPWQLLFDPISFLVAIYYAVVYTLLYMLFSIYPIVFQQKRGWNAGVGELPLIGTVAGACIGGLALYLDSRRTRSKSNQGGEPIPEDRLPGAMVGGVMFAVTIFWFSWTAEYNSIHWAVPTVAGCFLATSILLIFVVFVNYIIDSYLKYAASAIAANTILRSACAAASPLFTQYMFDTLGVGGAGSLVGGVGILLMPIPFVFYKYGAAIRARSEYAVTDRKRQSDEEAYTQDRSSSTDSEKDELELERQQ
jgi:hypothetical protein